jgi:hypothetical protein
VLGRRKKTVEGNRSRRTTAAPPTSNANFFSYHASRAGDANAPRSREEAPVRRGSYAFQWKHIPTILAGIAILVSILYTMTLGNRVTIKTLGQKTPLLRDQKVYQEEADRIFNNSILSKTKLTINTQKFEEEMKQQFPELGVVSMTVPIMGRSPLVELISEKPALLITSQDGIFVLNQNGKAIARLKDVPGVASLNLATVNDETNIPIKVGKGVLSSQDVTFITSLVYQFSAKGITVSNIKLPPEAAELRVEIVGQKYFIKFNLLNDPRISAGQFIAAYNKIRAEKGTVNEYIDARVEEKIFYK